MKKTISFNGHLWRAGKSTRGGDYLILRRPPSHTEMKKGKGCITALEVRLTDLKEYQPRNILKV